MPTTYENKGPIYLTQAQYNALTTKEIGREYCIIGGLTVADLPLTSISGYDATKTQTLKHVQGVFQWVDN